MLLWLFFSCVDVSFGQLSLPLVSGAASDVVGAPNAASPYRYNDVDNFNAVACPPTRDLSTICRAGQVAFDQSGGFWHADDGYARITYFPFGSKIATRVFPAKSEWSIVHPTANTATSLRGTYSVALRPNHPDELYVGDTNGNRILVLSVATLQPIDFYGQESLTSDVAACSQTGMSSRTIVAFSHDGSKMYVADPSNSRILRFSPGNRTAEFVIGQPSFDVCDTSPTVNDFNVGFPQHVTVDSNLNVYVSMAIVSPRVLVFAHDQRNAFRVIGQQNFTESVPDADNVPRSPYGAYIDEVNNHFWVTDYGNGRILVYDLAGNVVHTLGYQGAPFLNGTLVRVDPAGSPDSLYGVWTIAVSPVTREIALGLWQGQRIVFLWTPPPPSSTVPAGTSQTVIGSISVVSSLNVLGSLNVTGALTVRGTLAISKSGSVNAESIQIFGSVSVAQGGVFSADKELNFGPNASLMLAIAESTPAGVTVVQVAAYKQVTGGFQSVVVETNNSCTMATGTAAYSSNTLTVAVAVENQCGGLSTGALIGIVVGTVLVAMGAILLIVLLFRYSQSRSTKVANERIRLQEMDNHVRSHQLS